MFPFSFLSKGSDPVVAYSSILEKENEGRTDVATIRRPLHLSIFHPILAWVIVCIVCVSAAVAVLAANRAINEKEKLLEAYKSLINSDSVLPFPHNVNKKAYETTIVFEANGNITREGLGLHGSPVYTGPPSEEIDIEWDKIVSNRFIALRAWEAEELWGENYTLYFRNREYDGYIAGVDVLHSLYCLNSLRKAIDHDYYSTSVLLERVYLDQCIDQIRQALQCSSDTTLIPTRWFEKIGQEFAWTDRATHTCRNFDDIRNWTTQRFMDDFSPERLVVPNDG